MKYFKLFFEILCIIVQNSAYNRTSKTPVKFVPTFKLIEYGPVDIIVIHQIG